MRQQEGSANLSRQCSVEHEPGNERRKTDQHCEGIMIEVSGLQSYNIAGDIQHARRDPVRTKPIDQPAVAALPQQSADPKGGSHEYPVVNLVEIPFVEEKLVQRLLALR